MRTPQRITGVYRRFIGLIETAWRTPRVCVWRLSRRKKTHDATSEFGKLAPLDRLGRRPVCQRDLNQTGDRLGAHLPHDLGAMISSVSFTDAQLGGDKPTGLSL